MKPLILEYAEMPITQKLDFSLIEYSHKKNLNVIKGTQNAAIVTGSLDTETFTKAFEDVSESDPSRRKDLASLIDTGTYTLNSAEPTDTENTVGNFSYLLDTQLITESRETTDSDKDK